jgi:hypothetical protein
MSELQPVFELLEYSLPRVEEALAEGEIPHFEAAIPTWYDAFFSLGERLGVLAEIESLPDPRSQPYVPLPLLIMLTICRFLHCHKSFRRVGEVLLKNQALLQRLGVAPFLCEHGYYRGKGRKPFDEECFSEVFRLLGEEPLQELLVHTIQALRQENPQWFRAGWFVMDSNHFRLKGTRQEYKWCALMLWTPRGLFPVAIEFSPVPGDGETTIGKRLVARALATYGPGFLRVLVMDAGYLDGGWLRQLKEEHGIDWIIKAKEDMIVVDEMLKMAQARGKWRSAPPPKLDGPKEEWPTRHICFTPELYGFVTCGLVVNGCVVRDEYAPTAKHPEAKVMYECLLTSQLAWKGRVIHEGWRHRWDVESTFGQMTTYWGLGKWPLELYAVYRALILIMALTYTILQAYLTPDRHHQSLQGVADRLAEEQGASQVLVRVGGACVIAGAALLNRWIARGVLRIGSPSEIANPRAP